MKALYFFCFFAVSFSSSGQTSIEAPEAFYQKGISLLEADKASAYRNLKKALTLSVGNPEKWQIRAASLTAMGDLAFADPSVPKNEVFGLLKLEINSNQAAGLPLAELHLQAGRMYIELTTSYDSAILHLESACKIKSRILGQWDEQVATCYYQMGNVYKYYIANFSDAERCYELSLRIREQSSSSDTLEFARTYYNLATTNRSQQDLGRALSYGITAIELFRKINHPQNVERSYTVVANIYRDMGEWSLASEHYEKAIALNLTVNKSVSDLAWHYVSLGELLKIEKKYKEAIGNLDKALSIYQSLYSQNGQLAEDDKFLFFYAQYMIAETYLLAGEYPLSHEKFNEHLETLRLLKELIGWQAVDAYSGLGHVFRETGDFDSALHYYQTALRVGVHGFDERNTDVNPTEEQIGMRHRIHRVLSGKAMAYLNRYNVQGSPVDLNLALKSLQLAERLLSEERNTLDSQESRWNFSDDNFEVYDRIVEILFEKQRIDPATEVTSSLFEYLERSKARSLSEALVHAEKTNQISRDDSLLKIHFQLQRELLSKQASLEEEEQKTTPDANTVTLLRESIVHLFSRVQRSNELIEIRHPGFVKVSNPRIPELEDLQTISSETGSLVLDFFWGRQYVYLFAASAESSSFMRLSETEKLNETVDLFLRHFHNGRPITSSDAFHQFCDAAYELYDKLLAPVSDLMADNRRLLIIPDGRLSQLPFEALISKPSKSALVDYRNLDYLIRDHIVGYIYAAAVRQDKPYKAKKIPTILGMAYTGSGLRQSNSLPQLTGATSELKAVEERWANGKFLTGGGVTESNFKMLAPQFDIIHLAVHGMGDPGSQYSSRLFFEQEPQAEEDSELHAFELYGMALNARLAVLTACESGLGKAFRGESMLSMASAFTLAGCANTVISLWKLGDKSSVQLIDDFYAELVDGKDIDVALSLSKNRYLDQADELTAHPKFWASLVSYGDQNRVVRKAFPFSIPLLVLIGLMVLLMVFRRRFLSTK